MAAGAAPRPLGALRAGKRGCAPEFWICVFLGTLLLFIWWVLLPCFSSGVDEYAWRQLRRDPLARRVRAGPPLPRNILTPQALASFFFPTTCVVRGDEQMKACSELPGITEEECLKLNCCFSPLATGNCVAPATDRPTQRLRVFVTSMSIVLVLAWLPFGLCYLCQRSTWANSLRRRDNLTLMRLKTRRRPVGATDVLNTDSEDDGGKKEETRALVSP